MRRIIPSCVLLSGCFYTNAETQIIHDRKVWLSHETPDHIEPMSAPARVRVNVRGQPAREVLDAYVLRYDDRVLVVPDLAPERTLELSAADVVSIDVERTTTRDHDKYDTEVELAPLIVGWVAAGLALGLAAGIAFDNAFSGLGGVSFEGSSF